MLISYGNYVLSKKDYGHIYLQKAQNLYKNVMESVKDVYLEAMNMILCIQAEFDVLPCPELIKNIKQVLDFEAKMHKK